MEQEKKQCIDCKEWLILSSFQIRTYKQPYLRSYCKMCNVKRTLKWEKENRSRRNANQSAYWRRHHPLLATNKDQ